MICEYESDFDTNGAIYFLGTRHGGGAWSNPALNGGGCEVASLGGGGLFAGGAKEQVRLYTAFTVLISVRKWRGDGKEQVWLDAIFCGTNQHP